MAAARCTLAVSQTMPDMPICGAYCNVVGRRELGHAAGLGDAAGARHVGLQEGERAVGDQPHRLVERVVALARGQRRGAAAVQLLVAGLVLGAQRLLEPEIAVVGQRAADLDRLLERVGPVGVDAELDVVAGALAQPLDAAAGVLHRIGDLHLDAREALFEVAVELAVHERRRRPSSPRRHRPAPRCVPCRRAGGGSAGRRPCRECPRARCRRRRSPRTACRPSGRRARGACVRQCAVMSVGLPPDEARLQRGLDQLGIGLRREPRQRLADAGDAGVGADLDEADRDVGVLAPGRDRRLRQRLRQRMRDHVGDADVRAVRRAVRSLRSLLQPGCDRRGPSVAPQLDCLATDKLSC